MNGPATYEMLTYLILGIIGAQTLSFAAFWKIWSLIDKVKTDTQKETEKLDKELSDLKSAHADFRTHVAEVYVTKAGMQEQTGQMLRAIEGLGNRIDGQMAAVTARLDLLYQNRPASSGRSRSTTE
jgi:septal ring factor EnvC (AmiA/AmiB activator)